MKILAIIVDFQGAEEAARLCAALAATRVPGVELEVVHVDNGNQPARVLSAAEAAAGVILLATGTNGGYAAGLNAAVRARDPRGERDAYWFLNSDLRLAPDCLAKLVDVLRAQPGAAAVGPRVLLGDTGRVWGARGVVSPWLGVTAMHDWPVAGPLPRWSYIPGSSLLVRAPAYRKVGGLPENYRLYFEETEFCVRLQREAGELWVEPAAVAYHEVRSRESGLPARHFAYFFARNGLYFWRHCFGIPWPAQLPRTLFVVSKELLLPLRHASSPAEALDRLKFVLAGLRDGVAFARGSTTETETERRWFPRR